MPAPRRMAQQPSGLALMGAAAICCLSFATAEADPEPITAYTIVNAREIPESLTGAAGDAPRGEALFLDALTTGCALCHSAPKAPLQGPEDRRLDLGGVGARQTPGQLRLWLVAPDVLAPETDMPAFYRAGQRRVASDPLYGGPRLTAGQIEDLVAWLSTLTGPE